MKCPKCSCEEFRLDGTAKYRFGTRQRFKCKRCGKPTVGDWLTFDEEGYRKYQGERLKEWQNERRSYIEAKEKYGQGGFRLSDL